MKNNNPVMVTMVSIWSTFMLAVCFAASIKLDVPVPIALPIFWGVLLLVCICYLLGVKYIQLQKLPKVKEEKGDTVTMPKEKIAAAQIEEIVKGFASKRPIKNKFKLIIKYRNGVTETFSKQIDIEYKTNCIRVYLRFYRWYYTRTSPAFTMITTTGATVIIRAEITAIYFVKEEVYE